MNAFKRYKHHVNKVFFCTALLLLTACNSTPEDTTSNTLENAPSSTTTANTNQPSNANESKSDSPSENSGIGSAGSTSKDENTLPQRIALMPFTAQEEVSEEIMTMLRQSVFSHLSGTNYLFVRPQEVDQRILLLDQQTDFTKADAPILTGILEADAVLLGSIISSDVTYAGVAAQIYYKVEMTLVDKTGKVIWSSTFSERSIEGGFSADPFSMLYNLAITAMHVGKENMFAVADKIGRQVATSIPQPEGAFTLRNLMIESVIHDGTGKSLKYGDTLKVGVKAPANMSVNLSIENVPELFSAAQTEPGTYFADIPVNTKWDGKGLLLTAYVVDKMGNRARKISHLGLLNFDNTPPRKVIKAELKLSADTLTLNWQHPENGLSYDIYEVLEGEKRQLQQTADKTFSLSRPHQAFQRYEFIVVASDKAGNQSEEFIIGSEYLPNNVLKQSDVISKAKLPSVISVDSRLTLSHSPYLLDATTTVDANAILFIEPGVVLEFTQSGSLNIEGSLGTFGQAPVVFKSINDNTQDQTFVRINTEKHVEFNSFKIVNAGIGIEVLNGKPKFRNGEISSSKYTAISIQNMANVSIENCIITGSNTSAVVVANNARLTIKNSQLLDNFPFHIQNSSTYSVDARNNQWQPAADAISILGNVKY